jgi:lipopolysaccharide transport system permease protein
VLWIFVNNALTNAANSLTNSTNLITKVYFPRLIMPLAAIAATMFDLLINLAAFLVVLLFSGVSFSWQIVFAPFFVALLAIFAFAFGTLLAAVNVRFRDVRFVLPFMLQILMFATPVFYPLDFVPERLQIVWKLNPLTGIFQGFRASVFALDFDIFAISVSIVLTFLMLILGVFVFRRMEDDFADLI